MARSGYVRANFMPFAGRERVSIYLSVSAGGQAGDRVEHRRPDQGRCLRIRCSTIPLHPHLRLSSFE